jgi:GTP-binding protein EngB required for normal cell division
MSLGIDFGTCWTTAAVVVGGQPRAVKEPQRQTYSFPSAVFWDVKNGAVLAGEAAEFASQRNPFAFAREFKKDLGKSFRYSLDGREFSAEDLLAAVLKQVSSEAALLMGDGKSPSRAVLTVPAHWSGHRHDCARQAARSAGLEVDLLAEPIAAAIYHEHRCEKQWPDGERVLIYRLGGGTFDAALLVKQGGVFEELIPSRGSDEVSGLTFDQRIFRELLESLPPGCREQLANDHDEAATRLRQNVWAACRGLKHQLSHSSHGEIHLDQIAGNPTFSLDVGRFESLIRSDLELTVQECRRMIADLGIAPNQPLRVVLVGGSTRIPLVARVVEETLGRRPEKVDDPELAVCYGAALHAARVCPDHDFDTPGLAAAIQAVEKKLREAANRPFVFLLTGRTGVGKSSTINSLLGKKVAPVGDYEPTTAEVKSYPTEIGGVRFHVVDTPGLCDGKLPPGDEMKYLRMMSDHAKEIDNVWFVTPLIDSRIREDEIKAVRMITRAFGKDIWNHAVIVFTFANDIKPPSRYAEALSRRGDLLRKEIAESADGEIAKNIPAVAVDNFDATTLDGKSWKGELYMALFRRLSDEAALTFHLGTAFMLQVQAEVQRKAAEEEARAERRQERRSTIEARRSRRYDDDDEEPEVSRPTISVTREQRQEVHERVSSIVERCTNTGASWGRSIGGSTGESIGRSVGNFVGNALKWLGF